MPARGSGFRPESSRTSRPDAIAIGVASALVDAPFPDLGREDWTKTVPPEPNRFVADVDAAFVEQILDIAKRQRKANIHHHRKANDRGRSLEVTERIFHPPRLTGANR